MTALAIQQIEPSSVLTDRVRDALVDAIVSGHLRPGERLAQEEIAQRLGVSRQPVSHALKVLKEQGLLVELGRKGLTVAPLDADRMRALYEARAALEALAARLAAERAAAGHLDPALVDRLQALVDHMHLAAAQHSVAELVSADADFHQGLYALCGNPVIAELTAPQWVQFRRCMSEVLADDARGRDVWSVHAAILAAIRAGDAARAERLARDHVEIAGRETAARMRAGGVARRPMREEDQ